MLFLTIFASILISIIAIFHFRDEAKEYHEERLARKENAVKEHIDYVLQTTTYTVNSKNIPNIFREKIHELADIHSLEINFFDLNGNLLESSKSVFKVDKNVPKMPKKTVEKLNNSLEKSLVESKEDKEGNTLKFSYSYIKDSKFKNVAILNIPYEENSEFYDEEVEKFMVKYAQVYLIMILVSIFLSYLLSRNITKSLTEISERLEFTKLNQRNKKIERYPGKQEINSIIDSYNNMVDTLEDSAQKLAQNERENAWREMAKQVAHEIKNPLTPMRLTVQSFQRKFDPLDENINKKLDDYTKTLIQQIDTMTAVASAFSNFATMPAQENTLVDFVSVTKMTMEIFNEDFLEFQSDKTELYSHFDKTQLIRIVTNLIKNSIQAIPENQKIKHVFIQVTQIENWIYLTVTDNGKGIEEENQDKIFEPKFTTKSSGMGLGLAMIKNIVENYNGNISFVSANQQTTFKVEIPLNN